jgi:anti-sigma factor RsiW
MKSQHLSDEAIAAFADGVLVSHARTRAMRHTAECPECAYAVAVQREAIWAMRAAPAPPLPTGLLDRLRDLPASTPVEHLPDAVAQDGTTAFAAFGTAALVPPSSEQRNSRGHGVAPIIASWSARRSR